MTVSKITSAPTPNETIGKINEIIDNLGGGGTDVQINGTSITSNNVANIVTNTAYNASTNKIATMSDVPSISGCVKLDGGSSQQTISLSSGTGTTPLGIKSKATTCYLSFTSSTTWLGSYGVSSAKKPTFYNGSSYTLAYTSDIPTIATSVSSSSTNAETVGAKLFYDTVGSIESALNTINSGSNS